MGYDPVRNLLLVAALRDHAIRQIDLASREARVLVGGHGPGCSPSGVRVEACLLRGPEAVDADPAGNVYLADSGNHVVRRVNLVGPAAGTVDIVAGVPGEAGAGGEGLPAVAAHLHEPCGVRVDRRNGSVYIVDANNHRVVTIDREGRLRRVVGTGQAEARPEGSGSIAGGAGSPTFEGDGLPGPATRLGRPHGAALDGEGNLYVVDNWNHRIRKLDARTGLVSTVAGSDGWGFAGDGGAATEALLSGPRDLDGPHAVWVGAEGRIFIADTGNNRIRVVEKGIIRTLYGTGDQEVVWGPHGLLVTPDLTVFFVEYFADRVRAVGPAARG